MKIQTSLTKLSAIVALAIILPAVNAVAATFTITNVKDSGAGSLRQAVLDANAAASADTIVFDATFFGTARTITLATLIAVSPAESVDNLTITGPGADLLTIIASGTDRIFTNGFANSPPADRLSISGMTLTRSGTLTTDVAAIQNAANLTVTNVVFSSISGGAIDNTNNISPSNLTVTNSVFDSNTGFFGGAAITNGGAATITNSTFTSNTSGAGGAIVNGGSLSNSGALTVTGCTFTNNTATSNSATGLGGGAIYSSINPTAGTATITNSTFTGNAEAGGSGGGGAIRNREGSMTVTNSTFTDNSAVKGGGAVQNTDLISISGCNFTNNRSVGANAQSAGEGSGGAISNQGGGQVTITNSIISGNSATNYGGGIYYQPNNPAAGPFLTITNSTISNNTSNSNNDTTGDGGGLYLSGGGPATTITGSTISGNTAMAGEGISGNGGGIWAAVLITMTNSTVSGNTAQRSIGGIYINNINGGAINFTNSTIVANQAILQYGGLLFDNGFSNVTVNLRNSIIANNTDNNTSPDLSGPYNSQGYNLIEDTTGANITGDTATNVTGVDPKLGPLQDNGGMTFTHALLADSPAIDKGKSADIMSDQRSLLRPFDNPSIANATGGDGSDIGAFEDQPPNTLPGDDVTVEAPAGDASVTFKSITQSGFTTFAEIVPPSFAGMPPTGYTILDDAPAYEIRTTALYTSPLTVCFTVNSITDEGEFARVRILHGENGELVDRTDLASVSFAGRSVCASVDSFSPFVIALAPIPPNTLLNISTRLRVEVGDNVLIGGFIVTGAEPKTVLIRAIGPSLPVPGSLANPTLELVGPTGTIASNDDWMDAPNKQEIIDTTIPPTNPLESAIVTTLPGDGTGYTAIMRGVDNGTGVALVEVYDLSQAADSELANISTRGLVQTGDNVMIGGFIVGGMTESATILVRGLGPSLPSTIANRLADPTLELRDADGALVSSNDNWMDSPQKTEIEGTTIPPTDPLESALFETLSPGAYTAILAGQSGGTGVGLVEVYRLP